MHPFVRHCAAVLLSCPAVAALAAADVQASATISYDFSFSDQASHVDLTTIVPVATGTTWVAALGSSDFSTYTNLAEARTYDRHDATQTAFSQTTLQGNGGSLSASVSASTPGPSFASEPFASAALSALIVLAPGATVTLTGHYDVSAASAAGSPYYATGTAYVALGPVDFDAPRFYSPYEYVNTDPVLGFPSTRSGDWSAVHTNSSGASELLGFALATGVGASVPVSPVPEPQTAALFVGGLAMVGCMARRRAGTQATATSV